MFSFQLQDSYDALRNVNCVHRKECIFYLLLYSSSPIVFFFSFMQGCGSGMIYSGSEFFFFIPDPDPAPDPTRVFKLIKIT